MRECATGAWRQKPPSTERRATQQSALPCTPSCGRKRRVQPRKVRHDADAADLPHRLQFGRAQRGTGWWFAVSGGPHDIIQLDREEWDEFTRVMHHHDTCKTLCDDFRYVGGETCREYRERLSRIWGNPDGIIRPEAPRAKEVDPNGA